jgi:hypothetical protein
LESGGVLDDFGPSLLWKPDKVGIKECQKVNQCILESYEPGTSILKLPAQVSYIVSNILEKWIWSLG